MKSFQAVIIAAILAAATAANEPVASPTFFKQELAEYEHQLRNLQGSFSVQTAQPTPLRPVVPQGNLGDTETSRPQDTPNRPSGVSNLMCPLCRCGCCITSLTNGPPLLLFDRYTHAPSLSSFSLSLFTS
jgi:hypothetical protein